MTATKIVEKKPKIHTSMLVDRRLEESNKSSTTVEDSCNFSVAGSEVTTPLSNCHLQKEISSSPEQQQAIRSAVSRIQVRRAEAEVVLISGPSGTGKTTIVSSTLDKVKEELPKDQLLFVVSGKYAYNNTVQSNDFALPFSAIIEALTALCNDQIVPNARDEIHDRLHTCMTDQELQIMVSTIPAINNVVRLVDSSSLSRLQSAKPANQFTFPIFAGLVRRFFYAVCSASHPVVLFLDDLQWADAESLQLLRSITTGPVLFHLLIIGCIRTNDNERPDSTSKTLFCDSSLRVQRFHYGPLSEQGVNTLVARSLQQTESETAALSHLVYQRTAGNVLFVTQFLDMLVREHYIQYNPRTCQHCWNLSAIQQETVVMESVTKLFARKIADLPLECRVTLVVASVLGVSSFTVPVLEQILQYHQEWVDLLPADLTQRPEASLLKKNQDKHKHWISSIDVTRCLDMAIQVGLIETTTSTSSNSSKKHYKFTHDSVQQAVGQWLPAEDEGDLEGAFAKGKIGEVLMNMQQQQQQSHENDDDRWMLFSATNLLLQHKSNVDKVTIAQLCLRAAQQALVHAGFRPASRYADCGLAQLGLSTCWEEHYDLTLELYSLSAEMHFANGSTEETEQRVQTIKTNARRITDTFRAINVWVETLGARGEWSQMIRTTRHEMSAMNMHVPIKASKFQVIVQVLKSRRLLRGRSPEELMENLPNNPNPLKNEIGFLLGGMAFSAYLLGERLQLAYTCNKLLQSTLRYGLGDFSSYALAGFGVLISTIGKLDDAYRFGKCAVELENRPDRTRQTAKIAVIHYALLNHLREPLRNGFAGFRHGFEVGFKVGDMVQAAHCVRCHMALGLFVGMRLPDQEREAEAFVAMATEYNLKSMASMTQGTLTFIANMLGKTEDPLNLKGSPLSSEYELSYAEEKIMIVHRHHLRMLTYYLLNDLDQAEADRREFRVRCSQDNTPVFINIFGYFINGLTCLAQVKRGVRPRYFQQQAKHYISLLQPLYDIGSPMVKHMMLLLEAEQHAIRGNTLAAQKSYEGALMEAGRGGFFMSRAVCLERMGECYASRGDMVKATSVLKQAYQAFTDYGAVAKLRNMEVCYKGSIQFEHVSPSKFVLHTKEVVLLVNRTDTVSSLLDDEGPTP